MTTNEFTLLLHAEFSAHIHVAEATASAVGDAFTKLVELATTSLDRGGKLIFFGNGGSAADAQHWATELTVRFRSNRGAIAALAITTDSSALTAIGNDFGFEKIFARQIEALARPEDLVIGISTSGRSANVITAFKTARVIGCPTVAFTGGNGGELIGLADLVIIVPSSDTARIQEMHLVLGHTLCAALESRAKAI